MAWSTRLAGSTPASSQGRLRWPGIGQRLDFAADQRLRARHIFLALDRNEALVALDAQQSDAQSAAEVAGKMLELNHRLAVDLLFNHVPRQVERPGQRL